MTLALVPLAAQAQNVTCTCRYEGFDYQIGESICLKSPSGSRMATCDMVLNNTSWRLTTAPCPSAALSPDMTPAPLPLSEPDVEKRFSRPPANG